MNRKQNRTLALVLIGTGIFLLAGNHHFGFFTVIALFLLLHGVHKVRTGFTRKGYIMVAAGLLILFGGGFSLLLAVVLISLGYFYIRTHQLHSNERHYRKQSIIESIKLRREPWVLRDMSMWSVIGEIQMDLSYAIPEGKETTIVLQGVIGNIDLMVPEDMGLMVTSTVMAGQTEVGVEKQAGVLNHLEWQSPNYWLADQQLKIVITYVLADVDIKIV